MAQLARMNYGLTEKVHRILAGAHLARLNRLGIKTKRIEDIPADLLLNRASRDLGDLTSEEQCQAEKRGDSPSASLDLKSEFLDDAFGIDGKEMQSRIAPLREAMSRRREEISKKPESHWLEDFSTAGLSGRQIAVAMQVKQQRALDPATDTGLVGNDYLHEPYRELRLAGMLQDKFMSIDIPAGFRSFIASNLNDARFLKTAANTTDAYTVNTSEDPTSGSQTWTPVKLMAVIFWNGEFEDDSLFPAEAALRGSLQRGLGLAMDNALLNGDTTNTAGANISASGGSLTLGTKDPRLLWNGLRGDFYRGTHGGKSADTFTGGIDGGGDATTCADLYSAMQDCGKYAVPQQASNLFLVSSAQSYWNVRSDALGKYQADILNRDIFGLNWLVMGNGTATHASTSNVPTDALGLWDGCPTNLTAAGVYDNTTKTKATAVLFNRSNFLIAWKRSYQVKVVDLDLGDQKAIVATLRCDFKPIIASETAQTVLFNIL